jgi:hypothetical protein
VLGSSYEIEIAGERIAAIEHSNDRRINLVSPTVLEESFPFTALHRLESRATNDVALGYMKSVEGRPDRGHRLRR